MLFRRDGARGNSYKEHISWLTGLALRMVNPR
jgi:hypothetical protein